ncbi:RNA polymerase sigma factor [Streptantibioticus rubrisoli]|uniref:SigE family RNA polymerase sigma factor n=1 Tax=Streptantibioticus rubrisoli TaxID=1387313 RepID=A0ABT1P7X1_9ACTN|nr:SigE family RNA polymerase sigma factor [Streptantibioticus rubrisoli]MCQ4041467.1 SigE family RNA polymerase sigma factor [Streptantibioticus rubrisoli]
MGIFAPRPAHQAGHAAPRMLYGVATGERATPDVRGGRASSEPGRLPRVDEREAALAVLFEQHYERLLRLAVLLGAEGDAEDMVAEAFCELHRRWSKLRTPDAAGGYLRTTVVNLTRMRIRRRQIMRRHLEPPDEVQSAEHSVLLRDDQQAVVKALKKLPVRQREALVLRYWLDLKEAEIATAMGISAGAVKSHTSRGMAALKNVLRGDSS